MSPTRARNERADARRSRAAILDAAVELLAAHPDASVESIATTAGVTRQTVYAHFPTRDRLLTAVVDRITDAAVAAMDAADAAGRSAADSLVSLLDASARATERFDGLLQRIGSLPVDPQEDRRRHAPVADRLARVIRRGQETGEFDDQVPTDWLVATTIKLGHAASEEVDAGRMSRDEARRALHRSLLRLVGATPRH